jgi:hypothetical protein
VDRCYRWVEPQHLVQNHAHLQMQSVSVQRPDDLPMKKLPRTYGSQAI